MNAKKPFIIKRLKQLPDLLVSEGEQIIPLSLGDYISNQTNDDLKFELELTNGDKLPKNFEFDKKGVLSGTASKGTARKTPYELRFIIKGVKSSLLVLTNKLNISPYNEVEKIKTSEGTQSVRDFWRLFMEGKYLDLTEILTRKATPIDIYYLLSRFATLTVWNAEDLRHPTGGKIIKLKNASPDYLVFAFNVAFVATPKDLFDYNRTLKDSLQTSRAVVEEAHKLGWNIEMAGFDKMVTASWVKVQEINNNIEKIGKGKKIIVHNYEPTKSASSVIVNKKRFDERFTSSS